MTAEIDKYKEEYESLRHDLMKILQNEQEQNLMNVNTNPEGGS